MEVNGFYTALLNDGDYHADLEDLGTIPNMSQQPLTLDNTSSSKPKQKHKGKNFNEEEDRLLAASWLNVSTDATQGTNQTKDAFWRRVYTFYEDNRESLAERSQSSLVHRWGTIQEAVSKFCGCLNQIEARNESGATIYDRVEQAEKLFKSQDANKKSFQFRHCWLQLRNQPKWHERLNQLASQKTSNKKQKASRDAEVDGSPRVVNVGDSPQDVNVGGSPRDTIPTNLDAPKRPMGKKKAKEAMRRGRSDACIQALDILWAKKSEADAEKQQKKEEWYAKTFALDQERLQLEQKRLAIEETKQRNEQERLHSQRIAEEERIMNMDMSCMAEKQKQYYMSLQAEIMARRISTSG